MRETDFPAAVVVAAVTVVVDVEPGTVPIGGNSPELADTALLFEVEDEAEDDEEEDEEEEDDEEDEVVALFPTDADAGADGLVDVLADP